MDKKARCGSCGKEDYVEGVEGYWVLEGKFMEEERWLCPTCADDAMEHGELRVCPCGCDGIADLCVYAGTCCDCGKKYNGGHGYNDKAHQCDGCKKKNSLCQHCASEFTCQYADENRIVCATHTSGRAVSKGAQ